MALMLNPVPQKNKILFVSGFCDDIYFSIERDAESHDVLIGLEKGRYEQTDDGGLEVVEQPLPVLTLSLNRMVTNFNCCWKEPFPKEKELIEWIMFNFKQGVMSMANWRGGESLPHAHYFDMVFAYSNIDDPAIMDIQEHLEEHKHQLFSITSIN